MEDAGEVSEERKEARSMSDTKELLIQELTAANGDRAWSEDMARRIASGQLELPYTHSARAHELAKKLREQAAPPSGRRPRIRR